MKALKKSGLLALAVVGIAAVAMAWNDGLTPGFWKNHTDAWCETYSPGDTVGDVFDIPAYLSDLADDTLLEALKYGGGPKYEDKVRILLRAAVAAILNDCDPDLDYPSDAATIIANINEALANGYSKDVLLSYKDTLDGWNNLGVND